MFIPFLGQVLHALYMTLLRQQKFYWPVLLGADRASGFEGDPYCDDAEFSDRHRFDAPGD